MTPAASGPVRRTVRPWTLIVFCLLGAAVLAPLFASLGLAGTDVDPDPQGEARWAPVAVAALILVGFGSSVRLKTVIDGEGIALHNVFRTRRVPWDQVAGATASYYGLHVMTVDGRVVTAGSLAKSNWSRWLRVETKADRTVALIEAEVHRRRSGDGPFWEQRPPS